MQMHRHRDMTDCRQVRVRACARKAYMQVARLVWGHCDNHWLESDPLGQPVVGQTSRCGRVVVAWLRAARIASSSPVV